MGHAEPLWTVEQVAEYLQVPVATVYKWNSAGNGPARLSVGRHVRYRPAEVDRWLDASREAV